MRFFTALVVLAAPAVLALPASPIQHVVVLMMENRAFDHLLGAYMCLGVGKRADWDRCVEAVCACVPQAICPAWMGSLARTSHRCARSARDVWGRAFECGCGSWRVTQFCCVTRPPLQSVDPSDPKSASYAINSNALDQTVVDPCHAFPCTTEQIFGKAGTLWAHIVPAAD